MNTTRVRALALGLGLALCLIAAPSLVHAKKQNANSDAPVAKAPKKKKSSGGKLTFNEGSAESRKDRDRRLSRECKGRSNSGACEGYTR
jgi:hypothetical protein